MFGWSQSVGPVGPHLPDNQFLYYHLHNTAKYPALRWGLTKHSQFLIKNFTTSVGINTIIVLKKSENVNYNEASDKPKNHKVDKVMLSSQ